MVNLYVPSHSGCITSYHHHPPHHHRPRALLLRLQVLSFYTPTNNDLTNNEPDNRVSGPCPYNHSLQFAFEGSGGFIQCESVSQTISPCIRTPVVGGLYVGRSLVHLQAVLSQYRQTCRIGSVFIYSSLIIINRQITRRSRSIISSVVVDGMLSYVVGILGMYLPLAI